MADTPWVSGPYHTAPWSDGSSAPGTLKVLSEAAQTVIAKDIPEAEAKLFAAAPDMAEALQGMVNVWATVCRANGWNPEHMNEYAAAHAALAKARGEQ